MQGELWCENLQKQQQQWSQSCSENIRREMFQSQIDQQWGKEAKQWRRWRASGVMWGRKTFALQVLSHVCSICTVFGSFHFLNLQLCRFVVSHCPSISHFFLSSHFNEQFMDHATLYHKCCLCRARQLENELRHKHTCITLHVDPHVTSGSEDNVHPMHATLTEKTWAV